MAENEARADQQQQTDESNGVSQTSKRTGRRSPSYPMFDLETALEYARMLYDEENFNWASRDVVVSHWDYTAKSSRGQRTLAALLKYGLIDETGSGQDRRVRLSELGKDILLDPRDDSPERQKAIERAALNPEIYRQLWREWGPNLPSGTEMEYQLVRKGNFNPNTVRDFISDFRRTIEFANLRESGIMDGERGGGSGSDDGEDADDGDGLPPIDPPSGERKMPEIENKKARPWDLTIPLVSGGQAVLRAPIPMTEEDYELLTSMLQTTLKNMKKAITKSTETQGTESGE